MQTQLPPPTLQAIADTARRGRLDEAAMMAARATSAAPHDPVLAALAGAIEAMRGQPARAIPYLETAHRLRPQDVTVRVNLAESLYRTGAADRARALATLAAAQADPSLRLARLGGGLVLEAGDDAAAVPFYRHIVARAADDWSAWNNLGNALEGSGDSEGAVSALRRALALAPDSAPIRVNLGNVLVAAGHFDEAERELAESRRLLPDDPQPLVSLHALLRARGREDEAFEALAHAARLAPDDARLHHDLGAEASRLNRFDAAEAAYRHALARDPAMGEAWAGLAAVLERINREDEIDALAGEAAHAGAAAPFLAFIDALRLRRAGRDAEALEALDRVGEAMAPERVLNLRGLLLDRLGRHDEAFAAFAAMNRAWQDDPTDPRGRARAYREAQAHAAAVLSPAWLAGWTPPPPPADRPTPLFLVGFPRSGTTLLDTLLMADPAVVVLEEEPFIVEAEAALGGIDGLAGASPDAVAAARDAYFARIDALAGLSGNAAARRVIVDKQPMHLNKVAIIRRLFPDARFVLSLRHPCDVLLSCFLTHFRTNNAMANFLDLADGAALYDLTFSHWEKARALFAPDVATVVYERLVEDAERELRPLFAWAGLAFPEGRLDHTRAARDRGLVSSASYAQVTEPLYRRAAGRWRRYEAHLAPVLDVLRPWAEHFGYGLDDGRLPAWPGGT